jgi:hypothetical protein
MAIVGIMRNVLSVPLPTTRVLALDLLKQIDTIAMIGGLANAMITTRGPMTVEAVIVAVHKIYRIIEIEAATSGLSAMTVTIVHARDQTHPVEVVHSRTTTGKVAHAIFHKIGPTSPIKSSLKAITNGSPAITSRDHTIPIHSTGCMKETPMNGNQSHNAM